MAQTAYPEARTEPAHLLPPGRAVVSVAGPEARSFLQGLVSNDMRRVSPERAVYAALLTPQGRFLHDLFVVELDGALLLDCEAERRADLIRRLSLYKLRAKVTIADAHERYAAALLFGAGALEALGLPPEPGRATAFAGGVAYVDPRLPVLGVRAVLPRDGAAATLAAAGFAPGAPAAWERLRLGLGVPDGSRDLPVEKALPLENGFDELNGVDWEKGCYIGQEVTARMRYRALVRRRLMPVRIDGPVPAPGTTVLRRGQEAGEMRSAEDGLGLALLLS
ncbi:MAG: folate-binding protein YgfZ, partial [Rhodospirillaceae bacterium]|nr:folate-binding protein YgfZ [Rhodospirillaceae bacterium]